MSGLALTSSVRIVVGSYALGWLVVSLAGLEWWRSGIATDMAGYQGTSLRTPLASGLLISVDRRVKRGAFKGTCGISRQGSLPSS
jgi:hypothetical protein